MNQKKIIYSSALGFSFLFAILYLCFFRYSIPDEEELFLLYMNQVGLYKNEENAINVSKKLKAKDVEAYIYKNEDLYVVVSGIGSKEMAEENGKKLKELSYSYILKKLEIKNREIQTYVETKNYQKALELIGNQSKRNAD